MDKHQEFNYVFLDAFDETITDLLGSEVLTILSATLLKDHDISRDELPYRLDTVLTVLTNALGVRNAKTILRAVMRKLYAKFRVEFAFDEHTDYPMSTYLDALKARLGQYIGFLNPQPLLETLAKLR